MFGAFAFIATASSSPLWGFAFLRRHARDALARRGIVFAAFSTVLVRRLGEAGLATAGGVLICGMLIVIDATEHWPLAALACS